MMDERNINYFEALIVFLRAGLQGFPSPPVCCSADQSFPSKAPSILNSVVTDQT